MMEMGQISTLPEAASLLVLGLGLIIVALLLRKKFSKHQDNVTPKEPPIPKKTNRA